MRIARFVDAFLFCFDWKWEKSIALSDCMARTFYYYRTTMHHTKTINKIKGNNERKNENTFYCMLNMDISPKRAATANDIVNRLWTFCPLARATQYSFCITLRLTASDWLPVLLSHVCSLSYFFKFKYMRVHPHFRLFIAFYLFYFGIRSFVLLCILFVTKNETFFFFSSFHIKSICTFSDKKKKSKSHTNWDDASWTR